MNEDGFLTQPALKSPISSKAFISPCLQNFNLYKPISNERTVHEKAMSFNSPYPTDSAGIY